MRSFPKLLATWLTVLLLAQAARAGTTPMEAPLREGGVTRITCDLVDATESRKRFKYITDGERSQSKKTTGFHYNVYVPAGYAASRDHHYPCLFLGGKGFNPKRKESARFTRDRWVVVTLVEAGKEGVHWLHNFLAAHDDVVKRVRIARGLKFTTGYSGTTRAASVHPLVRPGFAGVIAQAAGFNYRTKPYDHYYEWFPAHVLVTGCFGNGCFNAKEAHAIRRNLSWSRTDILFFKGGHAWATPAIIDSALDRMERNLFLEPRRPARTVRSKVSRPPPLEPVDAEGYMWYLRKCRRLIKDAKGKPARFVALRRALAAVRKGNLGGRKGVSEMSASWQAEMTELGRDPAVAEFERKALRPFEMAVRSEELLAAQVARGTQSYVRGRNGLRFSAAEQQLVQRTIAAYQAVLDSKVAAVFEKECRIRIASLKFELAGATRKKSRKGRRR